MGRSHLHHVRKLVDVRGAELTRLGFRLTDAEKAELQRRLHEVYEDFRSRSPAPEALPYSLFVALHRDVGRD